MTDATQNTDDLTSDPLKLAREAYLGSTSYFDASIRGQIEQDLRQSQGLHPRGSKYMADVNKSRSRLFRPKTRATIRKNEAVAAQAFFSTTDTVSVTAGDDDDQRRQASAEVMQRLLQHRLTKSIPWFLTCIGAYQDALTTGVVISYQCWQYDAKKKIDRPMVRLVPVENFRFDPGADWTDPINTSPYNIELIPMYVKDVLARTKAADGKTGEAKWLPVTPAEIMAAAKAYGDTTRLTREQGRTDSKDQNQTLTAFSIVWVHKNIVEIDGQDMVYYTLGTTKLLSEPVPLDTRYAHGKRPYVLGGAILNTHKTYWDSLPKLTRDVQAEINDLANLRIDNVRFALSKRYFVKRNKQVDIRSLMRNVAGSATLMDDPEKDVKTVDFTDVTGSAYQEQDRLNLDFDDISGSFNGASVQSNRKLNETVGGMQLLDGSANQVSGYQLRTFVETWVEPVLRQLILLEQYYETDETILALAGKQANLVERFGIDAVTDELLMQELTLTVNVGIGNTDPKEQVQNFMQAMTSLRDLLADGILEQRGLQLEEVIKELFGKLGYRDGARFFDSESGEDPQITQLKAQIQDLMQKLAQKEDPELTKARIALTNAQAKSAEIKDENVMADTIAKKVAAMFSAMQAGEVVAAVPGVAPVADKMLGSAGFPGADIPPGGDPVGLAINPVKSPKTGMEFTPGGAVAGDTTPMTPANPVGATEGMEKGMTTPQADSVGMADGGLVGEDIDEKLDLLDRQRIQADNRRMYAAESGLKVPDPIGVGSYANGGEIAGPGTGTSDSVPAVIDGQQPAAVSTGEYHVPAPVVQMFGPDFFEELIRRYHVPAEGQPNPDPSAAPVDLKTGDFIIPADVVAALGKDFFDQLIQQAGGQQ